MPPWALNMHNRWHSQQRQTCTKHILQEACNKLHPAVTACMSVQGRLCTLLHFTQRQKPYAHMHTLQHTQQATLISALHQGDSGTHNTRQQCVQHQQPACHVTCCSQPLRCANTGKTLAHHFTSLQSSAHKAGLNQNGDRSNKTVTGSSQGSSSGFNP